MQIATVPVARRPRVAVVAAVLAVVVCRAGAAPTSVARPVPAAGDRRIAMCGAVRPVKLHCTAITCSAVKVPVAHARATCTEKVIICNTKFRVFDA